MAGQSGLIVHSSDLRGHKPRKGRTLRLVGGNSRQSGPHDRVSRSAGSLIYFTISIAITITITTTITISITITITVARRVPSHASMLAPLPAACIVCRTLCIILDDTGCVVVL